MDRVSKKGSLQTLGRPLCVRLVDTKMIGAEVLVEMQGTGWHHTGRAFLHQRMQMMDWLKTPERQPTRLSEFSLFASLSLSLSVCSHPVLLSSYFPWRQHVCMCLFVSFFVLCCGKRRGRGANKPRSKPSKPPATQASNVNSHLGLEWGGMESLGGQC